MLQYSKSLNCASRRQKPPGLPNMSKMLQILHILQIFPERFRSSTPLKCVSSRPRISSVPQVFQVFEL
eukprot:2526516-Lingulodinium_polyedra.AAC.1